jgi:hypothetical protein
MPMIIKFLPCYSDSQRIRLSIQAASPIQFEFEMPFRSVRLQRFPNLGQVIAIFEITRDIDMFRPFFSGGDVLTL